MCRARQSILLIIFISLFFASVPPSGYCYDINDKLSADVSITGVYQYADDIEAQNDDSYGRGSIATDIGFNFHPTRIDEFQLALSFASGNGLHAKEPFSLSTYADDLEDDLKDINGRSRDYLLEAWYRHTFKLVDNVSLSGTFGIIDSTAYLDSNEFANDQLTQFMNEVFVNNPLLNLPSYDVGGVLELSAGGFTAKGLAMGSRTDNWESGKDTRGYNYYGLELGYNIPDFLGLGEGNYRVMGYTTTDDFESWHGHAERYQGVGVSIDQRLGEMIGVFARFGWQDDDAQIDYDQLYSIGLNVNGKAWGREGDEIGLGYAYLNGEDRSDRDYTHALEGYIKFKVTDYADLSLDIQYVDEELKHGLEDNDGMVYGIRYTASF